MIKPLYHRQARTPSSEQYQLLEGEDHLGYLDLHFGSSEVFGTLVLARDFTDEQVTELIEQIDEDLVLSAEVPREDFLVRVFVGREIGLFSDELLRDEYVVDGQEEFDE
jgi:hypothetical protein